MSEKADVAASSGDPQLLSGYSEQASNQSEERFRALVSASSDTVYRMCPDWREMRRLQGRESIAETAGPGRTWLERNIHPDDQPRVVAAIEEAVRARAVFEQELRIIRADGTLGGSSPAPFPSSTRKIGSSSGSAR